MDITLTIELIERERVAYVKGMEEYLRQLKQMSESEAKKKSFENLVQSKIIHENGGDTERYKSAKQASEVASVDNGSINSVVTAKENSQAN